MGEHKLPKPAPAPMDRPSAALLRIRLAINTAAGEVLPKEERDFFNDQAEMVKWIDHLEAKLKSIQPGTEET